MNLDISGATWHKSTRSNGQMNCVEVAENLPGVVLVRDTKAKGAGQMLAFTPDTWGRFLMGVRTGEFRHDG